MKNILLTVIRQYWASCSHSLDAYVNSFIDFLQAITLPKLKQIFHIFLE